jgi:hypothetical protein
MSWAANNARRGGLAMLLALALAAPAAAALLPQSSADGATLVYRKVFPNSSPEFAEIRVDSAGNATADIRSLDDDPEPAPFSVRAELVERMFELAAGLGYFQGVDLDVRRRIANLGEKTFRYERGGVAHETVFNYTLNREASRLLQIFEGLARQMEHRERLERRMRFDRLGIQQALLLLESDLNRGALADPVVLAPTLEAIADDERIMDMSRQRARALLVRIRQPS